MGGQSRPPLQMTVKNRTGHAKTAAFPVSRCRGRCPHRPAPKRKHIPRRDGWTLSHWISISRRRGGRPCPPAENTRFYGNPMRNRNIFNGPMRRPQASFEAQPRNARLLAPRWASAPTTDNARFHDFVGGQSRPPLQTGYDRPFAPSVFIRQMLAVPRYFRRGKCPVLQMLDKFVELWFRAVGVDAHIDPPQNGNTSRVGTDGRYRIGFRFRAVGADDPVRPRKTPVFTEIQCEIATFSMGRCDARRLVSRRNRATRGS